MSERRFIGIDPARGDDWACYVEGHVRADGAFEIERILWEPPTSPPKRSQE